MNIEAKANELYPVPSFDQNDHMAIQRNAYIKGREDERAELVGTPEEAEEVLKPYVITDDIPGSRIVTEAAALKAMQTMYAMGVAKERKARLDLQDIARKEFYDFESLQQEIIELKKQINGKVEGNTGV